MRKRKIDFVIFEIIGRMVAVSIDEERIEKRMLMKECFRNVINLTNMEQLLRNFSVSLIDCYDTVFSWQNFRRYYK